MAASDRQRAVARVAAMRWVWRGYLVLFVLLVAVFEWGVPVRHAGPVIAVLVFQAATTFAVWLVTRRLVPMRSPLLLVAMLLNAATIAAGSLAVGPLLVMPSFAATSLAVVLTQPTRFRPSLRPWARARRVRPARGGVAGALAVDLLREGRRARAQRSGR